MKRIKFKDKIIIFKFAKNLIVNRIYLGNWLKKNAVILKYRLIYIRKITHNNQLFQGQLTVIYQLVSTKSDLDPGNGLGKGH